MSELFTQLDCDGPAVSEHWRQIRDGHPSAIALYERHYSCHHYKDGRVRKLFVGPGQKLVLLTTACDALFAWRKFIDDAIPKQEGVNCAVFRNEGPIKSSLLIIEAMDVAWGRWAGERLYTYVDTAKTRKKRDPGRCFRKANWKPCGTTKGGLLILEALPKENP